MKSRIVIACGVALLLSLAARAEDEDRGPAAMENSAPPSSDSGGGDFVTEKRGNETIKYKKKTTYDFEGASIDGVYNKPSGSYISNIKDVKAKSIIKIRENFDAEVLDSARLLK